MSALRPSVCWYVATLVVTVTQTLSAQQLPRPALGVTLGDGTSSGVRVTGVYSGSPAQRVGVQINDQIVAINGQPVRSAADVVKLIGASSITEPIWLDLNRAGWKKQVIVALDDASIVMSGRLRNAGPLYNYRGDESPYFNPVPTPGHWIGPQRQGAGWVGGYFSSGGGYGGRGG